VVRRLFSALVVALLLVPSTASAAPDPLRAQQWNLDMIGADTAHKVTRGEGAVVAVIDTGVDASHEDLAGRLLPPMSFIAGRGPADENGHGTHVTGIVAANADNGIGVDSVAPGARVLPVRVLDENGEGSDADVAKGIDYAIAQKVDVINLSLGGTAIDAFLPGGEFAAAIQRAVDAGIVVVAAAGNDTVPICEQPRIRGEILCVGAVDKRGMRSFFSSGDSGAVMAPGGSGSGLRGEDVLSTVPGSKYEAMAGTSQAAPHVAGVAALVVSRGVRGPAAVARVRATARDAGMAGADPVYGVGIVDARAAVAGLGGGSGAAAGRVSLRPVQRIPAVLKRGMRVNCMAGEGECEVVVRRRGVVIAAGRGRGVFAVRVTSAGARLLRHARSLRAVAEIKAPGAPLRTLKVTFKR
jgi:subtilisin family serine protease